MNYVDRIVEADGLRRSSQTRRVAVHALYVDLPSDLAIPIKLAALKAGVTPEALIVDVLRDVFEPLLPSQGILNLLVSESDTRTYPPLSETVHQRRAGVVR